jgi:hypothetical protein
LQQSRLIRSVFPPLRGVRLVGVTLSNFQAGKGSIEESLALLDGSRQNAWSASI